MVSGLVTSPKLQERIFSGEAIEILIELKSLIAWDLSLLLKDCNVVSSR